MASVERNPFGPLRNADLVQVNDTIWWDKTRPVRLAERDTDQDFIARKTDRPDNLAFTELQDSAIAHTIMERNDEDGNVCRLWPNDFYPGRRLQIQTRPSLADRGAG